MDGVIVVMAEKEDTIADTIISVVTWAMASVPTNSVLFQFGNRGYGN